MQDQARPAQLAELVRSVERGDHRDRLRGASRASMSAEACDADNDRGDHHERREGGRLEDAASAAATVSVPCAKARQESQPPR